MTTAQPAILKKRLHGWLDDSANHVPLPPLPEKILNKAVFQVPDSWVPVFAVTFDCDKGSEPAPDAWLKPDGQLVNNQGLLAEHAKQFGMPEGFLALYFSDAKQDAIDGRCDCPKCQLERVLDLCLEGIEESIANERAEIDEQEAIERAIFDGSNEAVSDLVIVAEHAERLTKALREHFRKQLTHHSHYPELAEHLESLEQVIEIFARPYLDARLSVADIEELNLKDILNAVQAGEMTADDAAKIIVQHHNQGGFNR